MQYDYVIVGSGLYGATFADLVTKKGKKCLVVEKRDHIAGNIYTQEQEGIHVHKYGAHIFHTSNKAVWDYINTFATFNNYINSPIANYKGEVYNLPFNMNTFNKMWGVVTPEQAQAKIAEQVAASGITNPKNLEEKAISLVGIDIYQKLIKCYTEKQWGRPCSELPESIINRLPVRLTYDNNYFNDLYQGIPIGGYTQIIEKQLANCDIMLNTDYLAQKEELSKKAKKIIFTGTIDSYFDYCFGELEYRSVRFEERILNEKNHQGVAVVNYNDSETPYTRIIEHKHFEFGSQEKTILSYEYSAAWTKDVEPYYPVNNAQNQELFVKYAERAKEEKNVVFGGRLGQYKYYDMHTVIAEAFAAAESEEAR